MLRIFITSWLFGTFSAFFFIFILFVRIFFFNTVHCIYITKGLSTECWWSRFFFIRIWNIQQRILKFKSVKRSFEGQYIIMRSWGDILPGHSWHLNLKVFGHLYWTFVLFFSLYSSELMLQVPLLRQIDPCSITTQKGYLEWFELLVNLQAAGKLTCLFCRSSNWITNRKTKRRSSTHEHWTAPPLTSPPGAATLKLDINIFWFWWRQYDMGMTSFQ